MNENLTNPYFIGSDNTTSPPDSTVTGRGIDITNMLDPAVLNGRKAYYTKGIPQGDVFIGYNNQGYPKYQRPDGSIYTRYPEGVDPSKPGSTVYLQLISSGDTVSEMFGLKANIDDVSDSEINKEKLGTKPQEAKVSTYLAKDKFGMPLKDLTGNFITGTTQEEADKNAFRYGLKNSQWAKNTSYFQNRNIPGTMTSDMKTFNDVTGISSYLNMITPSNYAEWIGSASRGEFNKNGFNPTGDGFFGLTKASQKWGRKHTGVRDLTNFAGNLIVGSKLMPKGVGGQTVADDVYNAGSKFVNSNPVGQTFKHIMDPKTSAGGLITSYIAADGTVKFMQDPTTANAIYAGFGYLPYASEAFKILKPVTEAVTTRFPELNTAADITKTSTKIAGNQAIITTNNAKDVIDASSNMIKNPKLIPRRLKKMYYVPERRKQLFNKAYDYSKYYNNKRRDINNTIDKYAYNRFVAWPSPSYVGKSVDLHQLPLKHVENFAKKHGFQIVTEEGKPFIVDPNTNIPMLQDLTLKGKIPRFGTDEVLDIHIKYNPHTGTFDIPSEYPELLQANLDYIKLYIPNAKFFGSSELAKYGMPHVTDDFDLYITQSDIPLLEKVFGSSKDWSWKVPGHTYKVPLEGGKYGNAGIMDLNVLWADPATGKATGERAMELYRLYFPEEYYRQVLALKGDTKNVKITKTPEELLEKISPEKTLADNMESSTLKQENRTTAHFLHTNINAVNDGNLLYWNSFLKEGIKPILFAPNSFTNPEKNAKILKQLGFPLLSKSKALINNPERVEAVVKRWVLDNSILGRGIDKTRIPGFNDDVLTPAVHSALKNGQMYGGGVNTAQGNSRYGDTYYTINNLSSRIKPGMTPEEVISEVFRNNYGVVNSTPELTELLIHIMSKYGAPDRSHLIRPGEINLFDVLRFDAQHMGPDNYNALLNEISKLYDIKSISAGEVFTPQGGKYFGGLHRDTKAVTLLGDGVRPRSPLRDMLVTAPLKNKIYSPKPFPGYVPLELDPAFKAIKDRLKAKAETYRNLYEKQWDVLLDPNSMHFKVRHKKTPLTDIMRFFYDHNDKAVSAIKTTGIVGVPSLYTGIAKYYKNRYDKYSLQDNLIKQYPEYESIIYHADLNDLENFQTNGEEALREYYTNNIVPKINYFKTKYPQHFTSPEDVELFKKFIPYWFEYSDEDVLEQFKVYKWRIKKERQ